MEYDVKIVIKQFALPSGYYHDLPKSFVNSYKVEFLYDTCKPERKC